MKLLINATCVTSGAMTGIERFACHVVRELLEIDENTQVIASSSFPPVGHSFFSFPVSLRFAERCLGSREYLVRTLWDQTFFRYWVLKAKPDVIFFPIQDGLFFPGVRQIITVHDLHYLHFNESVTECRKEIPAYRRLFYRIKMPHVLRRSAAIIAVSETTKQQIIESFDISADKIHVVYNGYDSNRFHGSINLAPMLERLGVAEKKYFLFVGSILRHKNIVRLVEAFIRQNHSLSLVIAGVCKDPDYLEEVMDASAGLWGKRILYLKYVTDDDLPSLYSGALAFILPSLHEGFGVPILEAMACGTPVITSNCSAMPEVAGDAALLVDPYSVESIATAMSEVFRNPQRAGELKVAGLERCKQFTWSHSARKLYDVCTIVSAL